MPRGSYLRQFRPLAQGLLVALLVTGCVNVVVATPAPTPQAVMTAAPASLPPPSPSPSPSPSPEITPSPEERAVITAFVTNFALRQPPFHLDGEVRVMGSDGIDDIEIAIAIIMDIEGENFDGKLVIDGREAHIRLVDGVAYGRRPGEPWAVVNDFEQTQPLNPFKLLDPADLAYVGMDGRPPIHQLRTSKWIGDDLDEIGLSSMEIDSSVFDIYVSRDGIPVEALLEFSISGILAGRATVLEYEVEYQFSDVGQPLDIQAPI